MSQNVFEKIALYLLGSFILVLGVTLILVWRQDVAALFRGGAGMALALAGMLVLYSLNTAKSKN
ncbi:MAG: hypothetical protein HZA28_03225 [Candidatus Omnitrophica bacterium]|nr:hypothetical protein [Candidatus Omnitrophota bacterium]